MNCKKMKVWILPVIIIAAIFWHTKVQAQGDVLAVRAVEYDSGDTYSYTKYYVFHSTISNAAGNDSIVYSYTDWDEVERGSGDESYIYTYIEDYYDYYPTLPSACSSTSYFSSMTGEGQSFYLDSDMTVTSQVFIDKSLTLYGCGHTLKNGGGNMDIFYANSGDVSIYDLILDGCGLICNVAGGTGVGSACITNDGADMTLSGCRITGSHNLRSQGVTDDAGGTGVECFSGDTAILNCTIDDCDGYGIYVGNWRSPKSCKDSFIRVFGCRIYDCGGAIGNAYGASVMTEGCEVSNLRNYRYGMYNSNEGSFTMNSGKITGADIGIWNRGEFFLRGGELISNNVAILQDGRLIISGDPKAQVEKEKNTILLPKKRMIEIDKPLRGDGVKGAIMLLSDDRKLGREILRITYKCSDDKMLYQDAFEAAKAFVPAFYTVPDRTDRNEEGSDTLGYLSEAKEDVYYTHPDSEGDTPSHPAVIRAGAGYDKNGKIYNGSIGSAVLSAVYTATFDLNSNVKDINLSMKKPTYDFFWMEPMFFPTGRGVSATLYEKKVDESLTLLGWSVRSDGSRQVYTEDEIMAMPNDFTLYPVLDATFALTYHSNFKNPRRHEMGGKLITSYGDVRFETLNSKSKVDAVDIDTSYTVYPKCDGNHSENIIRGNTGPFDMWHDYLVRTVATEVDDINYGRVDYDHKYRHIGWSPTKSGITYRNISEQDPMTHLYIRQTGKDDPDGGCEPLLNYDEMEDPMRLYGDISMDGSRHIRENESRLFRLKFLSDYISLNGIDYTDDGVYFNLHLFSVWDEAPYLSVKNIEILEGDIDTSLKDMLYERIRDGDSRHIRSDYEDRYEDISITIPDLLNRDQGDIFQRFMGLGDMGSATIDYEAQDKAGNRSIYHLKVTVLSGSHHHVLKIPDDPASGLRRGAYYYRFISGDTIDTLLPESIWRVSEDYSKKFKAGLGIQ